MMLCGIDLVETERIRRALERHPEQFVEKVFTPEEAAYCKARGAGAIASFSARFAAKEAVSKALGTGIGKHAAFREIEILALPGGKPVVKLSGEAYRTFLQLGGERIALSMSHTRLYAVANVVIETKEKGQQA